MTFIIRDLSFFIKIAIIQGEKKEQEILLHNKVNYLRFLVLFINLRLGFHLTVNQLCFRPSSSSFQLAGCSNDGTVRVFNILLS